jgi:hypothetical protein
LVEVLKGQALSWGNRFEEKPVLEKTLSGDADDAGVVNSKRTSGKRWIKVEQFGQSMDLGPYPSRIRDQAGELDVIVIEVRGVTCPRLPSPY